LQAAKIMRRFFYEAPAEIMRIYTTCTVKLGYNEHARDRLILFVIAVIGYNRENTCTKVAIWDQKCQIYSFVIAVNSL